ncbi:ATP synthase subunit I [Vibrio porteresiae]|uniref:ATP synthase subunit I n=1 Tax=Vibrio porteresiae DSM 19223 TaxID=1123496 RepID=A0ABZ0QJD6_9VIBR|nr:ATP synthase subunit I [Vibrio porteresiae]WPC76131.1 ATP synthase subunit I [Vibrio porteresiae DSM 19223]
MEANSTSKAIMLAGRRILFAQAALGVLFVIGAFLFAGQLSGESAVTGVVIAVLPSLFGMGLASIKSRSKPSESLRDLMNLSRNTKVIYTIIMFVLTFRLLALRNIIVLVAFSVAMLGHFFTPFFTDRNEGKA